MTRTDSEGTALCALCGSQRARPFFRKNAYQLWRCQDCSLVFVFPQPTPDELKRVYSFESGYFVEAHLDDRQLRLHRDMARERLNIVEQYAKAGRVLDVGCGLGLFLKEARDRGWQCWGCEFSEDLARYGRERLGLDVLWGTLESLQFPSGSFDVVTLWDVLEHTLSPIESLRRVFQMLAPGGLLFLVTPNIEGLYPALSYWPGRVSGYWPHPTPPAHTFQFSKRTLAALLQKAGFQVLRIADRRIRLSYSLNLEGRGFSFKRWLYAALFSPLALLGPAVGAGDEILVVAVRRKP